ncbi:hypothetical protein [Oceanobacillus alkalisoli]|uniref:hypothetical protein n=1 Tax=Oceanobacillus alkalisoli TaxID=2925113 RepID=UPI001F12199F|nr:hypothetical protein [Oceanobacillus alkalisoli]MCF3942188.1 hypothetical protein [Oceanobacillus alkalisoli]
MKKVILTKEQADAIEDRVAEIGKSILMNNHSSSEEKWIGKYESLNKLTPDEMAKALYIGYEIEETFEVGDWIKDTSTGAVIEIINKQHRNNIMDNRYTTRRRATPSEIAEEKERRWWKKHNRDVWELKRDDLLKNRHNLEIYRTKSIDSDGYYELRRDGVSYFHQIKDIREHFCVTCFAENRLDREGGE